VSDKSSTWLLNRGDLISALSSETETPNRAVSLREILDFPCPEAEQENYQEALRIIKYPQRFAKKEMKSENSLVELLPLCGGRWQKEVKGLLGKP
jgi:hypothetical protein